MEIVFIPFVVVAGSFLLLRRIFLKTEERRPSKFEISLIGLVS
jgi:hypothetical protein